MASHCTAAARESRGKRDALMMLLMKTSSGVCKQSLSLAQITVNTTPKNVRLRSIRQRVPEAARCIARNTKLIFNLRVGRRSTQNAWIVERRICVGQGAAPSFKFSDDWQVAAAHVP